MGGVLAHEAGTRQAEPKLRCEETLQSLCRKWLFGHEVCGMPNSRYGETKFCRSLDGLRAVCTVVEYVSP